MNAFKPNLCVLRKTKPEHYDIKQIRNFAKEDGFSKENIKLGRKVLCQKLKAKHMNTGQPKMNEDKKEYARRARKGKNRNIVLADRSPLLLNVRMNPKQLKTNLKSCINQRNKSSKRRRIQRTVVEKNLMKYHKRRNYKYKPIINQLPVAKRNPLLTPYYNPIVILAVLFLSGDMVITNLNEYQRVIKNIDEDEFTKALFEYESYKKNPNLQIQSIEVPRNWTPSIGKKKLNISDEEKVLTCSIQTNKPLFLDTMVYIESEIINDTINHVYDVKNLVKHMKNKGYCPGQSWKQLKPDDIKLCSKSFIANSDLDVQGLLYVRELQKIQKSGLLIEVETMLSQVHGIQNKHKVVIHARSNKNIKERRGNCGSAVIELYDFIQEQKSESDKKKLIKELSESLPVCIEAKCNFIREFVEMKKGCFKFSHNSGITKDGNISNACILFIKKWCKESEKKSNPREYFLGKLPDLFTRVQALLQNKNASNGKIDYRDIMQFIFDNGEYMLNCGNLNFNNINLNTEIKKRKLFGMIGII